MKKGNCGEALFAKPAYCTISFIINLIILFLIIKDDYYKDPFRD